MVEPRGVGEPVTCTPPVVVYRVSRQGRTPYSPPPWTRALPDGTFGGRFDDPAAATPGADRFRIVYAASTREAALGETIARFRPSMAPVSELRSIDPAALPAFATGTIPATWLSSRQMGEAELDGSLRFVDISAHRTLTYLRSALARVAHDLEIVDIDLGAVAGPQRRFTQACARQLHGMLMPSGEPCFAGIRYPSRLSASWECWAIYADRLRSVQALPRPISADDPDLVAAASHLGLSVEGAGLG